MSRALTLGLALGFGAGGTATYLILRSRDRGDKQRGVAPDHIVFRHGVPTSDILRTFHDYAVSFDTRLRNPRWVLEHITKESANGEAKRKNVEFFEDPEIDVRFRNRLSHFKLSGYDRGHMAPAANHKSSPERMNETFNLINTSPQVGKGFNRDYWARFERFVKELTNTCDDVWIMTGPLYIPKRTPGGYMMNHPMIGTPPTMMAVPTHFFKVVLAESGSGLFGQKKVTVGAFVMPNGEIHPDMPLTAFAVPIGSLECVSGLRFFPAYLTNARRAALDEAAVGWQHIGRAQLQNIRGLDGGEQSLLLLEAPVRKAGPTPSPSQLFERAEQQAGIGPGSADQAAVAAPRRAYSSPPFGSKEPLAILPQPPGISLQRPVTGPGGAGAIHICEHTECKLSPEDWWKPSKQRASLNGKAVK